MLLKAAYSLLQITLGVTSEVDVDIFLPAEDGQQRPATILCTLRVVEVDSDQLS